MSANRLDVLKALIELSSPLNDLRSSLQKFDWDFQGVPIEFGRIHLVNVLRRYLNRELVATDIEQWANLLEAREDIFFEKNAEGQLDEVLYELANPVLTASLDDDRASAIIEALTGGLSREFDL